MPRPDNPIPFTSSDVWVLLALSYAANSRPTELRTLIEAGDYINKAVFTPQELRRGLAKLIAGGFAEEEDMKFSLTPAARELLRSTRRRSVYDQWHLIEKKLGATRGVENEPGYQDASWSYPMITDELFGNAVSEYRAAVEDFIRRDIRKKRSE